MCFTMVATRPVQTVPQHVAVSRSSVPARNMTGRTLPRRVSTRAASKTVKLDLDLQVCLNRQTCGTSRVVWTTGFSLTAVNTFS